MAESSAVNEELSTIINTLWNCDENLCVPYEDYEIDLQGYVTSAKNIGRDRAAENLFSWLDEEKVFGRPTYKAFRDLLDNYESELGRPEEVTEEETQENRTFLDLITETAVMREAHQFLVDNDKAPEDVGEFKQLLYNIWFKLYRRTKGDRDYDSCGFEHVFVGETRDRDVTGFHNWLQFYLQEKRGNIDYRGYFRRGTAEEEVQPYLVTLQFLWKKASAKPIGSSFIGTSPEFEVALYTLVFLMSPKETVLVNMQGYEAEIVVYRLGRGIGSAFPISKCD